MDWLFITNIVLLVLSCLYLLHLLFPRHEFAPGAASLDSDIDTDARLPDHGNADEFGFLNLLASNDISLAVAVTRGSREL